jgi:hypothetical protein
MFSQRLRKWSFKRGSTSEWLLCIKIWIWLVQLNQWHINSLQLLAWNPSGKSDQCWKNKSSWPQT